MLTLLPDGWKPPIGYANGMLAPAGARIVFIAGQVGWNAQQVFDSEELLPQSITNIYRFWLAQRGVETIHRAQPKVGRNEPCPCGSGKKYKKCCATAPEE